jgi:WD40 repeat protein
MTRFRFGLILLLVLASVPAARAEELPSGALARLGSLRLGHGGSTIALAYSPDGKTLATGGWDMRIRLWDVSTGTQVRQFQGHTDAVWGVRLLPPTASGSSRRARRHAAAVGDFDRPGLRLFRATPGRSTSSRLAPGERTLHRQLRQDGPRLGLHG